MKPKLEVEPKIETSDDWKYCEGVLPLVSRTFALNIAQLEGDIYLAVLLGYLFFRIADTFEDNVFQNETQKIEALHDYARIFEGDKALDVRLTLYESLRFKWEENSPEKNLVENGSKVIRCYFDLPQTYRKIIDARIAQTSECMAMFQEGSSKVI